MRVRLSVRPLAATNGKTAGDVGKRHDAVHLGRKEGLGNRDFSPGPVNGPPSLAVRSWAAPC